MERHRHEIADGVVVDLIVEVEDLGFRQRPGVGLEAVDLAGDAGRVRLNVHTSRERHQRPPPAAAACTPPSLKCGITYLANTRRLLSTCSCGTVSSAFRRKLTRSTPHSSHFLHARRTRSGSPIAIPSGTPASSPGLEACSRSAGSNPADGYDVVGYSSRAADSCAARKLKVPSSRRPTLLPISVSSCVNRKLTVETLSLTNSPTGSQFLIIL